MTLSIPTSLPPMEALLVPDLPRGPEWQYEPKWDGFRCLAFKNGTTIDLKSKSGQPLDRYFPEIVAALRQVKAERFAVDGELLFRPARRFPSMICCSASTRQRAASTSCPSHIRRYSSSSI